MQFQGQHISLWLGTSQGRQFLPAANNEEYDTVIIGAGITGLTTAYLLKESGKKVAVVERNEVASGSTGNSSAHLSTLTDLTYRRIEKMHSREDSKFVARSLVDAVDKIEGIIGTLHIECGFSRIPGYFFTESREGVDEIAQEYAAAERAGLSVSMLETVPLPFDTVRGFELKDQAVFHPVAYCNGLARAIDGNGSKVFTNSPVVEIVDGEPCTVRTETSTFKCRDVVIATHTPIGLNPLQTQLSISRSFVIAVPVDRNVGGLFWNNAEPYEYIRPYLSIEGREFLVVGGKDHPVGHGNSNESMAELVRFTRDRFGADNPMYYWSTQHYDPSDSLPYIGKSPLAGHSYVATGFSGDGLTFGTAAAMVISDQILGKKDNYGDIYKPSRISLAGLPEFFNVNFHTLTSFAVDRIAQGKEPYLLSPDEATIRRHGTSPIAYYKDEKKELHSRSAVCSHMKCIVHWNNLEKSWDCPCHGSRFGVEGTNLEGPSLSKLPNEPA